jgi:hypothetical protein
MSLASLATAPVNQSVLRRLRGCSPCYVQIHHVCRFKAQRDFRQFNIFFLSEEPREIFRFSSTPTRDIQSSPSTPLTTPKKLPRNPNGVYRWEGAGSAKHARPRNRYASPAFSASPSKQDRSALKESIDSQDLPLPDSKRRRVGNESSSLSVSTQRSSISEPTARKVPFPSTASPTPGTNGVGNRSNPLPSPSRLRSPVKPTSPVVPSPLRQAWSENSSTSSQNETRRSPSQTKTANFMAELIKETTPPKKPDLANPYQLASPVGKVGPPRRSTKRPRATGRPVALTKAENEEEKEKKEEPKVEKLMEYSPQTIIEATVPKVRIHKQKSGGNRTQIVRRGASDRVLLRTSKNQRIVPSLRKKILMKAHARDVKHQL